jgi:predicted dehydrogenase
LKAANRSSWPPVGPSINPPSKTAPPAESTARPARSKSIRPNGAVLYRNFNEKGDCKENPLKPPKLTHHAALMRHFKDCIAGRATPSIGGDEALTLMRMIEGIYRSSEKAKSMQL